MPLIRFNRTSGRFDAIDEDGTLVATGDLAVPMIPDGPGPHLVNGLQFIADPVGGSQMSAVAQEMLQNQ